MISLIGNILLSLAILLSLMTIICSCYTKQSLARILFHSSTISICTGFVMLAYAFITSNFSLQTVFFNSSTIKPLIYKIGACWSSNEGSLLLWLSIYSIMCSFYLSLRSKLKLEHNNYFEIIVFSCLQIPLLILVYCTSNPFTTLSFIPSEGLGLNPLLQDNGLVIHPPILYIGYITYAIPFAITIQLLALNKHIKINNNVIVLLQLAKLFSGIAIITLTTGITLGAWWAYRELGWGGYWFFDPVENLSLLPWLSGLALHHALHTSINSQKLIKITIALCILTFLLGLLSTFLIRSGILISVHSFASNGNSIYFAGIYLLISIPSIAILVTRLIQYRSIKQNILSSKEKLIFLGIIFLSLGIIIILISILYPIIYSCIFDQQVTIETEYFTNLFIPITIPVLVLASMVNSKNLARVTIASILSLIFTLYIELYLYVQADRKHIILSFAINISAIFLIIQTILELLVHSHYFRVFIKPNKAAMILGHLGLGLLALSINLNVSLQKEYEFIGKIGDKHDFGRFDISLDNIKFGSGQNYYTQMAQFSIYDKQTNSIVILQPENRLYTIEKAITQDSDIYSYLTHDIYAILNQIDANQLLHCTIYYRPMISIIWLSILVLVSGFILSFVLNIKTFI
ncbi:MAG: cytochrome c-type biogenesis CcmF C-terminal domain-containing protein [Rickettsiaceae bacterium]